MMRLVDTVFAVVLTIFSGSVFLAKSERYNNFVTSVIEEHFQTSKMRVEFIAENSFRLKLKLNIQKSLRKWKHGQWGNEKKKRRACCCERRRLWLGRCVKLRKGKGLSSKLISILELSDAFEIEVAWGLSGSEEKRIFWVAGKCKLPIIGKNYV